MTSKAYSWIIIIVIIIIHFFFLSGVLGKFNFQVMAQDPFTILHLLFTLSSNIIMAGIGADNGIEKGMGSSEFTLANGINNDINLNIMPKRKEFNSFVRKLNEEEKASAEEEFLLDYGVKSPQELTKRQYKKYKKIKYIKHDTKGITLPLYFERTKGNKIKYQATFDVNSYKARKRIAKAFISVITGFMSVNIVFNFNNFIDAFAVIVIVIGGLVISYLTNFMPVVYKFRFELPNKVINKQTLYNSFKLREKEFLPPIATEKEIINKEKGE